MRTKEEREAMNKRVSVIVPILFVIGIVVIGCSKEPSNQKVEETPLTEYQFDATVLEIYDEYLMVDALEGQSVVGEIKVWIGLLKDNKISGMREGDTVRITHDGKMTMSIPTQMSAVEITNISK